MKYLLCHKDIPVAVFSTDGVSVLRISINEKQVQRIPVGVKSVHELKQWILNRGIPNTRDGIKQDLGNLSNFSYLLSNLGVSLTDCYWFKPIGYGLDWEDVSPYRKEFREPVTLDLSHECGNLVGETNFLPSSSLNGDLKKKWLILNGSRVLVKGNYGDSCIQSIAEVFSSRIHQSQRFSNYVLYSLINISSSGKIVKGCMCKAFTSEELEFVSAYDLLGTEKKSNNESYYQQYVRLCGQNGINIKPFLDYMFMTDFILSNTDRHLNNFGLLRNPDTLRYVRPAPIFDSGNSFFYKSSYIPVDRGLLNLDITSFYDKEVKMLKTVSNPLVVNCDLLPPVAELASLLKEDTNLSNERLGRIARAYGKKIEYLRLFQSNPGVFFNMCRKASHS